MLYHVRDMIWYVKENITIELIYPLFVLLFGENPPGCRLFNTASMLEWLRNSSPTTHRGAVRKDGKSGHCQSVLRPRFFFNFPFILNNSVETAAPFNVVIHPRCSEPRNYSLEKFRPLAGFEPMTVGTKCRVLNR